MSFYQQAAVVFCLLSAWGSCYIHGVPNTVLILVNLLYPELGLSLEMGSFGAGISTTDFDHVGQFELLDLENLLIPLMVSHSNAGMDYMQ
ncbi:hypothetical protein M0R45_024317 [Rubus argutus]|uniref:Uncharacterized protein n=1 Tax=Rubus argutus TaxID=59490 RepID=A0AAW1WST6_RUBAR